MPIPESEPEWWSFKEIQSIADIERLWISTDDQAMLGIEWGITTERLIKIIKWEIQRPMYGHLKRIIKLAVTRYSWDVRDIVPAE